MSVLAVLVAALWTAPAGPDPSLVSEAYLSEVARHLYRWHLDENDVHPEVNRGEFVFWIRPLRPDLDAGDDSRFAEIRLPRIGVRVIAKKADYVIPELGVHVRNDGYAITSVARVPKIDTPAPDDTTEVRLDYAAMRDYLFRTRTRLRPPGDDLLARMRLAARDHTRRELAARGLPAPTTPQAIHLAPISPVANEAWVFWEEGRLLFRFHADLDLDEPALWEHHDLAVQLFDLDEQVVVSLDEVAGSNAYVTRDMVGRALYNCVVLGRRVVLDPAPETPADGD